MTDQQIVVEIDVEGGMITQVKAPRGVTVTINDYDTDGVEPEKLKSDINGWDYAERNIQGTGRWIDA